MTGAGPPAARASEASDAVRFFPFPPAAGVLAAPDGWEAASSERDGFWLFLSTYLRNVSRMSSAPPIAGVSSSGSTLLAENFAKRVSSSSGSSTLVIMTTSAFSRWGIASIISGILASFEKPQERNASVSMSRNSARAFSDP